MPAVAPTYGMWLSAGQIAGLPQAGAAWAALQADATGAYGTPQLYNTTNTTGAYTFAGGLYYQATGDTAVRQKVHDSIGNLVTFPSTLADMPFGQTMTAETVSVQLPGYVLAADLINLGAMDSTLDGQFRSYLARMLTEPTSDLTVTQAQETLPDRVGAEATFTRMVATTYLGDLAGVLKTIVVLRGWMGDRATYSDLSSPGFDYGVDGSWQVNASLPVPINAVGAVKFSNVDGVIPDEQRKGGSYQLPVPQVQTVWSTIRFLTAAAWVLRQRGTDVFADQTSAIRRAAVWMRDQALLAPSSRSAWVTWVLNQVYPGLNLSTGSAFHDSAVGYTDWTHAFAVSAVPLPAPRATGWAGMFQPAPTRAPTLWGSFQWNNAVWNGSLVLTSGPPPRIESFGQAFEPTSNTRQTYSSVPLIQGQGQVFPPVPWSAAGVLTSLPARIKTLAFVFDPSSAYVKPPLRPGQGSLTIRGQWLPGTVVTFFDRDLVPEWMREIHDPLEHAKVTTRLASQVGAQELFVVTADGNGDVELTDQVQGRYWAAGERDGTVRYVSVNVEAGG